MNEYEVIKQSKKYFIIGLIIVSITSIITTNVSWLLGFILGYAINLLIFYMIIQTSSLLLDLKASTVPIIVMLFIGKLLVYALGFYLSMIFPEVFSVITVFLGYFVIKITIYAEEFRLRGGGKR